MKTLISTLVITLVLFSFCSKETEVEISKDEKRKMIISGSDSEKNLVKLLVKKMDQQANFTVQGGGSGIGIEQLILGHSVIANSSREINIEEEDLANSKGLSPVPVVIALDAVALVCNPKCGVDSISTLQIQQIFCGEVTNWKEIGGVDKRITLYGRNNKSGTYQYVKDKFIGGKDFPSATVITKSNKEIIENIKKDPTGIGYVGVAFIKNEFANMKRGIWALNIFVDGDDKSYSPLQYQNVSNGNYPFVRPLYQYVDEKMSEDVRNLIEFELSKKGQDIIYEFGYFPISSFFKTQNDSRGF